MMKRIKLNSKIYKQCPLALSILVLIYCAVTYSAQLTQGVKKGLVMCTTTLVPSLFVFLIISSYITSGRCADVLSVILDKPSKKLLKISGTNLCVLLISMIGGYPVGAICIKSLYKTQRISKAQAQKLSLMAVCSGVGFVTSFVGNTLLKNKTLTMILFISVVVSYVFVVFVCHLLIKVDSESNTIFQFQNNSDIVKAVENGCKATMNMCAMVMLFSAVISVFGKIFSTHDVISDIICILLEVCTACETSVSNYPLYVTSFVIGFGGICVHFQIFSILKDIGVNKGLFFFVRIIQGITCAVTTYILLIFIEPKVSVFSTTTEIIPENSTTVWGSVALMLTAVCFLNSIKFSNNHRR